MGIDIQVCVLIPICQGTKQTSDLEPYLNNKGKISQEVLGRHKEMKSLQFNVSVPLEAVFLLGQDLVKYVIHQFSPPPKAQSNHGERFLARSNQSIGDILLSLEQTNLFPQYDSQLLLNCCRMNHVRYIGFISVL